MNFFFLGKIIVKNFVSSLINIENEIIPNLIEQNPYLTRLSKLVFVLCMFFVFFGTNLPFQSKMGGGVEEMVESNIINQLVFSVLFILTIITLIPKGKTIASILKEEKFLSIFLLWCAVTIFWSDYAFISFKRYFQYATIFLVILSIIIYVENIEALLKLLKIILIPYLILSLICIFIIPGAIDQYGSFRGFAASKNNFGQITLICTILFGSTLFKSESKGKIFNLFLFFISIILLFGSRSATAVLTVFLILFLNILLLLNREFENFGFRKILFFLTTVFFVVFSSVVILFASNLLDIIFGEIGKDTTLTGRTDIWLGVLENARSYIFTGYGYQSFWISENPFLDEWYQSHFWIPLQSHSGYIDIINELGLIGLTIFILWIIKFFKMISNLNGITFWLWIFIAGLLLNLTESTIIRARHPIGVIMILSYLVIHKKYIYSKFMYHPK